MSNHKLFSILEAEAQAFPVMLFSNNSNHEFPSLFPASAQHMVFRSRKKCPARESIEAQKGIATSSASHFFLSFLKLLSDLLPHERILNFLVFSITLGGYFGHIPSWSQERITSFRS